MLEQLRAALEMASGLVEVPRQRAEKLAKEFAKSGGLGMSQVSSLAEDIMKRSKENAEMVRALVTSELKRQIKTLGLATKEDIDRLGRRIDRLEKARKPAGKPKKPAAKKQH
jgi:polyhydroxyalkanoate synthesis regulator phasin